MDYSQVTRGGAWIKNSDVVEGTKVKILDEATRVESRFKDDKGNTKMQDVCKVKFQGAAEAVNVNLNRATIRGLVDAFGKDSRDWVGKVLTAHIENTSVAGKRVKALYLLPEGYEVSEDAEGYVIVQKVGGDKGNSEPTEEDSSELPF